MSSSFSCMREQMTFKLQVTLNHTLKNSTRVLVRKTKLSLHYIQTVLKTGLYTCNMEQLQYDLTVYTKSGRYKAIILTSYIYTHTMLNFLGEQ
jgi:hypothetical protein